MILSDHQIQIIASKAKNPLLSYPILLKEQLFIQLCIRRDSHEPNARFGEHGAPERQACQFDGNVPLAAREFDHAQEGGADFAQ